MAVNYYAREPAILGGSMSNRIDAQPFQDIARLMTI